MGRAGALTLVKVGELLARSGTVVPYRTLARFATAECGYSSSGRAAVTVPVADGEPGREVQVDFGYLGTGSARGWSAVIDPAGTHPAVRPGGASR